MLKQLSDFALHFASGWVLLAVALLYILTALSLVFGAAGAFLDGMMEESRTHFRRFTNFCIFSPLLFALPIFGAVSAGKWILLAVSAVLALVSLAPARFAVFCFDRVSDVITAGELLGEGKAEIFFEKVKAKGTSARRNPLLNKEEKDALKAAETVREIKKILGLHDVKVEIRSVKGTEEILKEIEDILTDKNDNEK